LYPPMNDPNDRRRRTVDRRRGDRRVALTLNQHQYPLTHCRQSRTGKDFQKFCWSKWKRTGSWELAVGDSGTLAYPGRLSMSLLWASIHLGSQHKDPLTKQGQSRIGKDFQKFCWSKRKIFRASGFLVTCFGRKHYAIDISAGQKIFLGGWSKARLLRQYVCIR